MQVCVLLSWLCCADWAHLKLYNALKGTLAPEFSISGVSSLPHCSICHFVQIVLALTDFNKNMQTLDCGPLPTKLMGQKWEDWSLPSLWGSKHSAEALLPIPFHLVERKGERQA